MDSTVLLEFIHTINKFDGTDSMCEKLKNYICYFSEYKGEFERDFPIDSLLHTASQKLKVFGYNKMNNIQDLQDTNSIQSILSSSIEEYHRAKSDKNILLDGLQKSIIDKYQALTKKRMMLSAPTSFGKTYILQEILFLNAQKYKNVMLIFPTIALLTENMQKYADLIKKNVLNYRIVTTNYDTVNIFERNMFIFTPERALKFLGREQVKIDFFFFDEVYKIEEKFSIDNNTKSEKIQAENNSNKSNGDKRAIAFRTCLYVLSKNVEEYYIVGPYLDLQNQRSYGLEMFLEKNQIEVFQIKFDPILRVSYEAWKKDIIETNPMLSENKSYEFELEQKNQVGKLIRIKNFIEENNLGKTILYINHPNRISNLIKDSNFYKKVNVDCKNNKELKVFIEHLKLKYNVNYRNISSVEHWTLIKCLEQGIGIHHGKMPKYIQNEILRQFNKEDGLKYLFCTSTLIEGGNTVAKNVIILSNVQGQGEIKKFALRNLKGRAGRYYKNFVGNVFYCDKNQKDLDDQTDIKLDVLNYGEGLLNPIDLDNTVFEDLTKQNQIEKSKRDANFNKDLLPDDIYNQNRLFDRFQQERIIQKIIDDNDLFNKLYILTQNVTTNHKNFIDLVDKILDLVEDNFDNKNRMIKILKNYEKSGFCGLLKYQLDNPQKKIEAIRDLKQSMDKKYATVFEQIRTTIEYDIPKYITLYQSLFHQACRLKKLEINENKLDKMIRFYEIGVTNEFATLLIEKGYPNDSAKQIEKYLNSSKLSFLNNQEIINFIHANLDKIENLDEFEKSLYIRIMK